MNHQAKVFQAATTASNGDAAKKSFSSNPLENLDCESNQLVSIVLPSALKALSIKIRSKCVLFGEVKVTLHKKII